MVRIPVNLRHLYNLFIPLNYTGTMYDIYYIQLISSRNLACADTPARNTET